MAYSAEIGRTNPTCFLFLIDQSQSMEDPFGGEESGSKSQALADAMNKILSSLAIRCAKEEGVRDYFHVGVIGYGAKVGFAFTGALAGRNLVPISEVANNPARVDQRQRKISDGAGGVVETSVKFPIWFDATAKNGTPMCGAFELARTTVEGFIATYPNCFPPIVINVTDGEANDGSPTDAAAALRRTRSSDGEVLLFNVHLSSTRAPATRLPSDASLLADKFAKQLFDISSELTPTMRSAAAAKGLSVNEQSRGFMFNAGFVEIADFLDIGTRPANLR